MDRETAEMFFQEGLREGRKMESEKVAPLWSLVLALSVELKRDPPSIADARIELDRVRAQAYVAGFRAATSKTPA